MQREDTTMPDPQTTYKETQVLGRTQIGLVVTISTVLTLVPVVTLLVTRGASTLDVVILGTILIGTLSLPWVLRINIRVAERELRFRFWPLPETRVDPAEIVGLEIVTFHPLGDFGGWGYKVSRRHGRVFCISGNAGVRFRVGKRRYVIAAKQPEEFLLALAEAGAPAPESLEPRSVREPPLYNSL